MGLRSIRYLLAMAAACSLTAFAQHKVTENENTTNKTSRADSSISSSPSTTSATSTRTSSRSKKIDLNTASKEELESLPGIGSVTADNIIAARPFKSVSALKDVRGIGPARYDAIESRVTVNKSNVGSAGQSVSGRDDGKPTQSAAEATRFPKEAEARAKGESVPVTSDPTRSGSDKPTSDAQQKNRSARP